MDRCHPTCRRGSTCVQSSSTTPLLLVVSLFDSIDQIITVVLHCAFGADKVIGWLVVIAEELILDRLISNEPTIAICAL